MKTVYIGLEGSGKTFLMGAETERVIDRNAKLYAKVYKNWEEQKESLRGYILRWEKIGTDMSDAKNALKELEADIPIARKIVSNIRYSKSLEEYAKAKGIEIRYWKDIEELEKLTECDLFIDEIGAYFDSRTFDLLPLSTRLWLAQAQKLGVDIWGGAQDWGQIDVSFRRLVKRLYELKKILGTRRPSKTFPAGKHPWAVIFAWRVAPAASSDSTELRTLSLLPEFYFAGKKSFARFDTNARVPDTAPPPLKKIVRHWYDEEGKIGYTLTKYK